MRERTPRHDRIGTQPRIRAPRTRGELAASFGAPLLIPAVLLAAANPVLAGGVILTVLGAGLLVRLGAGFARRQRRPTRPDPAFRGAD